MGFFAKFSVYITDSFYYTYDNLWILNQICKALYLAWYLWFWLNGLTEIY